MTNANLKKIPRRLFLLSSAALAGGALAFGGASAAFAQTKTLRIASGESDSPTGTMDPAFNQIDADAARISLVYERLIILDKNFTPQPQLAESWASNDAGDVWTIKLKPGIDFQNGKRMSAADVVYTYRRLIDPSTASAVAATFAAMTQNGIEAIDEHTVRFTLGSPIIEFPSLIANRFTYIVPDGSTSEELRTKGIGTGPFKVEEFVPGREPSVFVKNDNYWRKGLPKVDRVELRSIADASARISALLTGQIDLSWDVPRVGLRALKDAPNITVASVPAPYVMSLTMWVDKPPFDDVRVREAMKIVVDRQKMIDLVLSGLGQPASDHPVASWIQYGAKEPAPQRDVARAKQLLAEAGHPNGIDVELHTSEAIPGFLEMATLYQAMASEAGIRVSITKAPGDGYFANVWRKVPFMCTSKGARNADEAMAQFYLSDASWNDTHWKNEKFDGLIREARRTLDAEKRGDLYREAQHIVQADGGTIVPMFADSVGAHRRDLSGFDLHPQKNAQDFSEITIGS
jgi:peptide/nickel transport system substrate-binding protein